LVLSLPPVTAAATTSRTGRHRRSYFGGRGEVVNSLVFVATGSRRHPAGCSCRRHCRRMSEQQQQPPVGERIWAFGFG